MNDDDVFDDDGLYRCQDLWTAAFLVAVDVPLVRVEVEGDMIHMLFDNKTGLAAHEARRFDNGNPQAPARSLLKSWKFVNWKVRQARKQVAA